MEQFYQVTFPATPLYPQGFTQGFWADSSRVLIDTNTVMVLGDKVSEDAEGHPCIMQFQGFLSVIQTEVRNGTAIIKKDGPRLQSVGGTDLLPDAWRIVFELVSGNKGEIIFKGHQAKEGAMSFATRHFTRVRSRRP